MQFHRLGPLLEKAKGLSALRQINTVEAVKSMQIFFPLK